MQHSPYLFIPNTIDKMLAYKSFLQFRGIILEQFVEVCPNCLQVFTISWISFVILTVLSKLLLFSFQCSYRCTVLQGWLVIVNIPSHVVMLQQFLSLSSFELALICPLGYLPAICRHPQVLVSLVRSSNKKNEFIYFQIFIIHITYISCSTLCCKMLVIVFLTSTYYNKCWFNRIKENVETRVFWNPMELACRSYRAFMRLLYSKFHSLSDYLLNSQHLLSYFMRVVSSFYIVCVITS